MKGWILDTTISNKDMFALTVNKAKRYERYQFNIGTCKVKAFFFQIDTFIVGRSKKYVTTFCF